MAFFPVNYIRQLHYRFRRARIDFLIALHGQMAAIWNLLSVCFVGGYIHYPWFKKIVYNIVDRSELLYLSVPIENIPGA